MNRIAWGLVSLAGLTSLRRLDLSNNKTPAVHASLWGLTALTHLDLSHNSLDRVDAAISQLTGLEVGLCAGEGGERGQGRAQRSLCRRPSAKNRLGGVCWGGGRGGKPLGGGEASVRTSREPSLAASAPAAYPCP